MKLHLVLALSALALATTCVSTEAQLALSANDGKQPLLGTVPTSHTTDNVAVIDLRDPRHPTVIQTLQAGNGATGISFNKNDTLALVAATGGTVSVFSVAGKKLTVAKKVQLDPKVHPVDVAISPD